MLYPYSCRPPSLPTSSFYIAKPLEDLPDDDHGSSHVRIEWYSQDPVDSLLFTATGNKDIVSIDAIKGAVQNVKYVADDTTARRFWKTIITFIWH